MKRKKILTVLFGTEKVLTVIPGALLGIAVMLTAKILSDYVGIFFKTRLNISQNPVSMFLVAIILGMSVRNIFRIPETFEPGINFCVQKLLRLGIMLLGLRLSIMTAAKIGAVSMVIATLCVATGLIAAYYMAKLAGVSSRLGTLIAAGTGICGVSAVVAVSPCIGAKKEETTYAISTITIFGLIVTLIYPYLIRMLFHFNQAQAGIFLGVAIHDTSQVTGAAYIYDQLWGTEVSQIAITTKLIRNMLMVLVIPLLAMAYARKDNSACAPGVKGLWTYFPKFVLGFLAFAVLRSLGDVYTRPGSGQGGFLIWNSVESWTAFHQWIKSAAEYILATAISGAGLGAQFNKLKKLSYKPFLVGLGAAAIVGAAGFILVSLLDKPIGAIIPSLK